MLVEHSVLSRSALPRDIRDMIAPYLLKPLVGPSLLSSSGGRRNDPGVSAPHVAGRLAPGARHNAGLEAANRGAGPLVRSPPRTRAAHSPNTRQTARTRLRVPQVQQTGYVQDGYQAWFLGQKS